MLEQTFIHVPGVGAKTERQLWSRGVNSWGDYLKEQFVQQVLFSSPEEDKRRRGIDQSRKALEDGDTNYFARLLPKSEHYRIALSFPDDTYFLDIETTGLSHYYDAITLVGFSRTGEYFCHVMGTDKKSFVRLLSQAKCLVTFNGTAFDLKFLKRDFPELDLPEAHVDLRYWGRSLGLEGGQKKIEQELGIQRLSGIEGIIGEAAPVLWHQYRMGSVPAARKLVEYNHADVCGMKAIFDECLRRLKNKDPSLPLPESDRPFGRVAAPLEFAGSKKLAKGVLPYIPRFPGKRGPKTTYRELVDGTTYDDLRVVGIDLTGSEVRPTGWCSLVGSFAHTKRLGTDLDIFVETLNVCPDVVSIDSPLSMPKGRTRVTDDDPTRDEFGIVRACEHTLFSRGVNVYPSLIPSMQQLTARGIRLAAMFRKAGIPVIESYPGAAQDIMAIPRKRAGLAYLEQGLRDFGIRGDFVGGAVSHDELDAITSAIVGLFFWSGKFEALGSSDENFLIIPDLEISPDRWRNRHVVGLSGPIAAGKTTAAKYLEGKKKFGYARYSLVLEGILKERGERVNRSSLQKLGEEIHRDPGQRWLSNELVQSVTDEQRIAIDGIRFPEDHAFMVETYGPAFQHIHVSASYETRKNRYLERGSSARAFERAVVHPVESMIDRVSLLTHQIIPNEASEERFTRLLSKSIVSASESFSRAKEDS